MSEPVAEGQVLATLRWVGALFLRLPRPAGLILALIWTRVIWALSAVEGNQEASYFLKAWMMNSAHAPLFGFLAFLALVSVPRERSWPSLNPGRCGAILLGVLTYALVDEWHQSQVRLRDASGLDVITDLTGAACTLWIAAYLGKSRATSMGLLVRLATGLALCALAGLLAVL